MNTDPTQSGPAQPLMHKVEVRCVQCGLPPFYLGDKTNPWTCLVCQRAPQPPTPAPSGPVQPVIGHAASVAVPIQPPKGLSSEQRERLRVAEWNFLSRLKSTGHLSKEHPMYHAIPGPTPPQPAPEASSAVCEWTMCDDAGLDLQCGGHTDTWPSNKYPFCPGCGRKVSLKQPD